MSLETGFGILVKAWAMVELKTVRPPAKKILYILSIHVNKRPTHARL